MRLSTPPSAMPRSCMMSAPMPPAVGSTGAEAMVSSSCMILPFISAAALLVKVIASMERKRLSTPASPPANAISRYSFTRVYVFPDPAEALHTINGLSVIFLCRLSFAKLHKNPDMDTSKSKIYVKAYPSAPSPHPLYPLSTPTLPPLHHHPPSEYHPLDP